MSRIRRIVLTGLVIGMAVVLGGCASSGDGSASSAEEAATVAVPIPASSKLSRIKIEMSEQQVRKAIGEPDDIRVYPTGKSFIPFYFGGDTMRADWSYSGVGKVVFTNPSRWRRTMIVVELRHNPDEP